MMLFVGLLLEWTREWILGSLVATPSGTSWANLGGFVGQANFDRLFKQCLKIEDTHGYPQIAIFMGHYPPKYGVSYFQTNPIEQYTAWGLWLHLASAGSDVHWSDPPIAMATFVLCFSQSFMGITWMIGGCPKMISGMISHELEGALFSDQAAWCIKRCY